jgi:hypothetical protein
MGLGSPVRARARENCRGPHRRPGAGAATDEASPSSQPPHFLSPQQIAHSQPSNTAIPRKGPPFVSLCSDSSGTPPPLRSPLSFCPSAHYSRRLLTSTVGPKLPP